MRHLKLSEQEFQSMNMRISHAWDANVLTRAEDLELGTDVSYTKVIQPWILEEVLRTVPDGDAILDVGCGCGYLTNDIYESGKHTITGIDLSPASIAYAREKYPQIPFCCQDLYKIGPEPRYDLCLAVMALNNMPEMELFFHTVFQILRSGGALVLVIPHPCFWPKKHIDGKLFHYMEEKSYEIPFSTKGRKDYSSKIIYFHRPLEAYIRCIQKEGFQIRTLRELTEKEGEQEPDIMGMVFTKK